MCGRYTLRHQQWIEDVFGSDLSRLPDSIRGARHNVAPGQMVLALGRAPGAPVAEALQWGIEPTWEGGPSLLINARAEKLAVSPFWRSLLEDGRCLVPADGFFEWRSEPGRGKQPIWFSRVGEHPFLLAGLRLGDRCVVVTTDPNDLVAGAHDRMPAMLTESEARVWLDGDVSEALSVLRPFPSVEMSARLIGSGVNDVANDHAGLLDPVPPADLPVPPETLF